MKGALGKLRGAWPQLAALILVLVIDWLIFPAFFELRLVDGRLTGSFIDVLIRGAPVALLALGMAGVIATRGIDLSVGAIMAIAGAVAANSIAGGSPWYVAVLLALLAGVVCGLWNGVLVAIVGVQPVIDQPHFEKRREDQPVDHEHQDQRDELRPDSTEFAERLFHCAGSGAAMASTTFSIVN